MLTLPVTAGTFKKSFFNGDGTVELTSDQDAWRSLFENNSPFDKKADAVANMKIGVNGTKPLTFGGAGTMKVIVSGSVEAVHQIQLIWPDSQIDPAIARSLKPEAKQLLVRFLLQ